ncbi:hypothetical protein ABPG74_017983 [Tetrahymena malaccensis]
MNYINQAQKNKIVLELSDIFTELQRYQLLNKINNNLSFIIQQNQINETKIQKIKRFSQLDLSIDQISIKVFQNSPHLINKDNLNNFIMLFDALHSIIFQSQRLKKIDFCFNLLDICPQFFQSSNAKSNQQLESLSLDFVSCKSRQNLLSSFFNSFCKNSDLKQISLKFKDCNFSNQILEDCLQQLKKYINLEQLIIQVIENQVDYQIVRNIKNYISSPNLKHLSLKIQSKLYDNFQNNKLLTLMPILEKSKNLQNFKIEFSQMKLSDEAGVFFKIFKNFLSIQKIHINFNKNQIKKEGATQIFHSFSYLKNLTSLSLYMNDNDIKDSLDHLSYSVVPLAQLQDLDVNLQNCNLGCNEQTNCLRKMTQTQQICLFNLNIKDNQMLTKEQEKLIVQYLMYWQSSKSSKEILYFQFKITCEQTKLIQEQELLLNKNHHSLLLYIAYSKYVNPYIIFSNKYSLADLYY